MSAVVGLVAVLLGAARLAGGDILQDLGATFEQVARELEGAFPKVETRITAVDGAEVELAGANVTALRPGLELLAYRKGERFRHPITDQPLGQAEEEIGTLVVTAVGPDHARARVAATEGGRTPVVGDGARITAGRVPVAVLPTEDVTVAGETGEQAALLLVARLSALLDKTGRFAAADPLRVLDLTTATGTVGVTPPTGPVSTAPAPAGPAPGPVEVGRRLRVSGVVTSRLVGEGRSRALEFAWLSTRTGETLVRGRVPVVRAVFPPRFAWEQTPELERRYALEGPARGVAVADLDGDGRPEVVVADERRVVVHRWQARGGLQPVAAGEFRATGGQFLSMDAADINGTGRALVVVVEYRGTQDGLRSRVLEWSEGGFRTLHDAAGRYLRVVWAGGEPWLLEQDVGEREPFGPGIRRLVWREGRYRDDVTLVLPRGVTVYGLALMRLTGSPEPEVVALTGEDRLAVWTAKGRRLWTSADDYGGAPVAFPFFTLLGRPQEKDDTIGRILGRLLPLPAGPDGPELLVFENMLPAVSGIRSYLPGLAATAFTQGRIHRLRWRDGGFQRVWQSRITEGYVGDFAHGDVDGDGIPEVVVGVVPRGLTLDTFNPFTRTRSHLVLYELP